MPWLRWLTASLTSRLSVFNARTVHVGFVVDRVTLGQVLPLISSICYQRCLPLLSAVNSLNSANEVHEISFLSSPTNFKFLLVYAF